MYMIFGFLCTGLADTVEIEVLQGDEGEDDVGQVSQVALHQVMNDQSQLETRERSVAKYSHFP